MSTYTLLTGATGLVGRYLLRDLTLAGHRLAVIVRPAPKQSPAERVEAIMSMWEAELGHPLPRPVCLAGEVGEPGLGLAREARDWIGRHCDRILHNAAILGFHGPDRSGEPWRTNLGGTQSILELCREQSIARLHYVSTAYVAGQRQGRILESELDCGQGFRNDYEESKFLAEQEVAAASDIAERTIYRPVVLVGDSRTGYTNTYHGMYVYLKLISVLIGNIDPDPDGVRRMPFRMNVSGEETRNLAPIDWTAAVLTRLFDTPAAHGDTYHLAPEHRISGRAFIEYASRYYRWEGLEFLGPEYLRDLPLNDIERTAFDHMATYDAYLTTDPEFDRTNLHRFCGDLPCPVIDEPMLHRFLAYGERDRWGRRKPPKVVVPIAFGAVFEDLRSRIAAADTNIDHRLNLAILGPGGGDFALGFAGGELVSIELGLAKQADESLTFAGDDLRRDASLARRLGKHLQGVFE